ncbi:MAG: hypothetical protein AAF517_03585 [Planctomycetota bacterium]
MAATKRRALTAFLSLVGVVFVIVIGVQVYRSQRYLCMTRGVTLSAESGDGSLWDFDGRYLRLRHGKFRGWYLSFDHPEWHRDVFESFDTTNVTPTRSRAQPQPLRPIVFDIGVDNLCLTDRPVETSDWKLVEKNGEQGLAQRGGPLDQMPLVAQASEHLREARTTRTALIGYWIGFLKPTPSDNGTRLQIEVDGKAFRLTAPLDGGTETTDLWAPPEPGFEFDPPLDESADLSELGRL